MNAAAYAFPASVFVALFTVAPTGSGGGTEVSGTGYARVSMTGGWTVSGTAVRAFNTADVQYATVGVGGWGTANAFGIFTTLGAGDFLYFEDLTTPRLLLEGDDPRFVLGNLGITLT